MTRYLWIGILLLSGTWDDIVKPEWNCTGYVIPDPSAVSALLNASDEVLAAHGPRGHASSFMVKEFLFMWAGQGLIYAAH